MKINETDQANNASKVRMIMNIFGLTPTDIAKEIGFSRSLVSRIYNEDGAHGNYEFYQAIEDKLPSLIAKRSRRLFDLPTVDTLALMALQPTESLPVDSTLIPEEAKPTFLKKVVDFCCNIRNLFS